MEKKDLNALIFAFSVLTILFGVITMVFAEAISTAIPYVIGAVVLVSGICSFFNWLWERTQEEQSLPKLIESLIYILLGILIMVFAEISVITFVVIIALYVLLHSTMSLYVCFMQKKTFKNLEKAEKNNVEGLRTINNFFTIAIIRSVVEIVFAILLLVFCNSALKIIVTILGSGILAIGLYMLISQMISSKKDKDEHYVETTAEIVEEDEKKD